MAHTRRLGPILILLLCWWAMPASAQIRSATITGTVTDPTRAVIPGATVVLTNQETNAATTLVTTDRQWADARGTSRRGRGPGGFR